MRRFYIAPDCIDGPRAVLAPPESRHIAAVLRLSPGEIVELFDATGKVYSARLDRVDKKEVIACILACRDEQPLEHSLALTLIQGMLKGNKMDLVVRIATEMGVHTFQPLLTRFSERRINTAPQIERWQRIAVAACKQCGRNSPMFIAPPVQLSEFAPPDPSVRVVLWEKEQHARLAPDLLAGASSICLMLGPEGGFHPHEIELAREHGFISCSLGSRILRAESATIAATAIVQYLLGSFDPAA